MYITQDVANRIRELLRQQGKSMKEMLLFLGLGINSISEFSKGKQLSSISLAKIADYLNCSVDYLLGRTAFAFPPEVEKKNNAIVDIILRLRSDNNFLAVVQNINSLTPEQLSAVETFLSAFSKTEDN